MTIGDPNNETCSLKAWSHPVDLDSDASIMVLISSGSVHTSLGNVCATSRPENSFPLVSNLPEGGVQESVVEFCTDVKCDFQTSCLTKTYGVSISDLPLS